MAAKFKLDPAPTFEAPVEIPVPGAEPAKLVFKFKHKTKDEVTALYAESPEDAKLMAAILAGWELDDEFNAANIDRLLQNYHGAATAISTAYLIALRKGRLGN